MKKLFKIITILLIQVFMIGSVYALPIDGKRDIKPICLSPSLGVPQQYIQNIFSKTQEDTAGIEKLSLFLDSWLEENKRRAEQLRLDKIKDKADADLRSVRLGIELLKEKLTPLLKSCEEYPSKKKSARMIKIIKQNAEMKRKFCNGTAKMIHKNFSIFENRIPNHLSDLKRQIWTKADRGQVIEFVLKSLTNEEFKTYIVPVCAETLEVHINDFKRIEERKETIFAELESKKNEYAKRWQANDLNLVAEEIIDLRMLIEFEAKHDGMFTKWIKNAIPNWEVGLEKTEGYLGKIKSINRIQAGDIFGKMQEGIRLIAPFAIFLREDREKLYEKINALVTKLVQKIDLSKNPENIACFFIDEGLLKEINSRSPNITDNIAEAQRKGKEVIVFGLRQDVINLFSTWGGMAEKIDTLNTKVLLLEGHIFSDPANRMQIYNFIKINLLKDEQITVLSLAVFSCLEMILKQGIDLSELKYPKLKSQIDIFSSALIYKLFEKGFSTKEKRGGMQDVEDLIKSILSLMPDEEYNKLIMEILFTNNEEFSDYARYICKGDTDGYDDIFNNRFKKLLLKIVLYEQDPIRLNKIRPWLIEFWNDDMDFFLLAADYYPKLNRSQRRRLIELIFELDTDMIHTDKLAPVISLLTKDTDGLRRVFAFINSIYELCERQGDTKYGRVGKLESLNDNVRGNTYYLLHLFAKLFPRSEDISSFNRGEIAEATIILDNNADFAGRLGKTIFTEIRKRVHWDPNTNHTALFWHLLHYWHDQDKERLVFKTGDQLLYCFAEQDFREYNYAIKRLYEELGNTVPDEISGKDLSHFDIFLRMVDKEALLDKVNELVEEFSGESLSEIPFENLLKYPRVEAYWKTAWTILAYQGLVRKFESHWTRAKQDVYGADLQAYSRIKELRNNFINTMEKEKSDGIDILRSYTDLRKAVYTELMRNDSQLEPEKKIALFEFDLVLEQFTNIYMQDIISRAFDIHNIHGLENAAVLLALQLRNLCFSGLGNAALEEFAAELESGPLYLSQVLNIINSVEFETRKIGKRIFMDFKGHVSSVAKKSSIDRFKANYLDLLNTWGFSGKRWHDYEMDEQTADRLEEVVIGKIIRETGIPVLESRLVSLSETVKAVLKKEGDISLRPSFKIKSMEDLFKRFGSNEKDTQVDILSAYGKKALRSAKMAEAGFPVPPGVIINTALCHDQKILNNPEFIKQLKKEIKRLEKIGEFPEMKLFLFARSGSAYSFPGLLATIPNLGMNYREVKRLAKQTKDEWFAYDAYGNFLRAYATYVLDIPVKKFQDILNLNTQEKPQSIEEIKALVERYKDIIRLYNKVIPESLLEQVQSCIQAIYDSWNSKAAIQYRQKYAISNRWGTAAKLQKAVFGNRKVTEDGRFSGAGAVTLRFDEYNQPCIEGRFRFCSQGEALMSGAPGNYVVISKEEANEEEFSLEEKDPETYAELLDYGIRLYELFGQPQRIEFTIEQGKVYFLQSSDSDEFDEADLPQFVDQPDAEPIAKGRGAAGGAFRGIVAVDPDSARKLHQEFLDGKYGHLDIDGVVLILDRVNPEDINEIPKDTAIVSPEMSIHCETLAHKNGISACYHFPGMKFVANKQAGAWQIQDTLFHNGDVLSFDGHINRHVYHKSGFLYKKIIPLKERKDKSTPRADDKTEIADIGMFIEQAI